MGHHLHLPAEPPVIPTPPTPLPVPDAIMPSIAITVGIGGACFFVGDLGMPALFPPSRANPSWAPLSLPMIRHPLQLPIRNGPIFMDTVHVRAAIRPMPVANKVTESCIPLPSGKRCPMRRERCRLLHPPQPKHCRTVPTGRGKVVGRQ